MPRGENIYQLVYGLQKCPECGYLARRGHINFCKGDVVLCDLCDDPTPIIRDYHSIFMHYKKVHNGKKGDLLFGVKQRGTPRPELPDVISLEIIIPYGSGTVKRVFTKYKSTWQRLAKQSLDVWDTHDVEQFSLMAAIATFKLEYEK